MFLRGGVGVLFWVVNSHAMDCGEFGRAIEPVYVAVHIVEVGGYDHSNGHGRARE